MSRETVMSYYFTASFDREGRAAGILSSNPDIHEVWCIGDIPEARYFENHCWLSPVSRALLV